MIAEVLFPWLEANPWIPTAALLFLWCLTEFRLWRSNRARTKLTQKLIKLDGELAEIRLARMGLVFEDYMTKPLSKLSLEEYQKMSRRVLELARSPSPKSEELIVMPAGISTTDWLRRLREMP